MFFKSRPSAGTAPSVTSPKAHPGDKLPVTRSMTMPNGKTINVLRKDVLQRAIERTREVA